MADPNTGDDPAHEAVQHHLRAVDELWAQPADEPTGAVAKVRRAVDDRALEPLVRRSREADRHLAEALTALADRVDRQGEWQAADHRLAGDLRNALHEASQRLDRLDESAGELRLALDAIRSEVASQRAAHDALRTEVARLRSRQERFAADLVEGRPDDAGPAAAASHVVTAANDDLYRDLEAEFRGSREHVKALTEEYLPDVRRVGGPVLDIGCGRGEWLELLGEHGIDAYGVDLNATFAEENRARGLEVRVGDAVAHLAGLPAHTLGAVTGFHVAEHLPLDVLVALADRALDALRPGGVLILETPNPTNVRVGAGQFWIDPTHDRPLHPELLGFLLRHRGFARTELRFLHPGRNHDADWAEALGLEVAPGSTGAEILDDVRDALASGMDYAGLAWAPDAPEGSGVEASAT